MKRLEEVENKLIKRVAPDLIMISFDDASGQYLLQETYSKRDAKGNITKGGNVKRFLLSNYSKYIFTEETHAQVIIDFTGAPEGGNLHAFNTDELRKEAGLSKNTAFSFSFTGETQGAHELENIIEKQPYERKVTP